jgi:hypothetical protein
MFKKLFTVLFIMVLFSAFTNAQERTFMRPDGKIYKSKNLPTSMEVMKVKHKTDEVKPITTSLAKSSANPNGVIDTLRYPNPTGSNFGVFGQDWFIQWFKAPADLTIKGFAFLSTDNAGTANGAKFEGKIVKVNLTEEQLLAQGDTRQGYYPATGNGFNDITAFLDNPDRTGDWVAVSSLPEPFGADIWSDAGFGAPITPNPAGSGEYQWIQTNVLFEPTVLGGEIFGICYKNTGTTLDADRLGVQAGVIGYPGWKFYANGRLNPGVDVGWWSRTYTWDFLVEVDITGNTGPSFNSITAIPSGLDLGPFTVDANITDENAGNPSNAGVASAWLFWSIDAGATWDSVAMTGTEPNFSGVIPAQAAGTTVQYYLTATDLDTVTTVSQTQSFYIFAPTPGVNTLLVFNGFTKISGYPQSYYFGKDYPDANNVTTFPRDRWAYGPLTADLVNNYTNIIEICTNGPNDINNSVIRTWLEGDAARNYMLAGDEWIGTQTGWVNRTYGAGTFQFDILGINADHNDVNYAVSGDQQKPSIVYPQMSTALGDALYNLFNQVSTDSSWTLPMHYDPYYEITVSNWLDGVDFEPDVEVFMKGLGADSVIYNIGGNRTLPAGNKIAFFAYDPLSLDSYDGGDLYYWYGFTNEAPQVKVLEWFGIITDIKQVDNLVPSKFDLTQNFPNPFNPNTTIRFALPQTSHVVLKVYDVLGREVTTLINGEKLAGNYEVNFDASKFASGLYFYTLQAGNYTATKKMMLMK